MKKRLIRLAALSAFAVPVSMAQAATGTIDFIGEVTSDTCSLEPSSAYIKVYLGAPTVAALSSNIYSTPASFTITLSNCDPSSLDTAIFSFSGGTIAGTQDSLLRLVSNGGDEAQNVGVGIARKTDDLSDLTGNRILFNGTEAGGVKLEKLQVGTNIIELYAFYEAYDVANNPPTAGRANAQATFIVTYS